MSHLFASTDLKNFRVNLNMIGLDNRSSSSERLSSDTEKSGLIPSARPFAKSRLQYRLDKVLARLHILEGLLAAYLNIDEVIEIIRTEDEPCPVLMNRFNISEIQVMRFLILNFVT
ncbi:hypothetical protein O9992_11615 [Vibrio lentus]|nr:hypothetical protein [Vibrio lentus]